MQYHCSGPIEMNDVAAFLSFRTGSPVHHLVGLTFEMKSDLQSDFFSYPESCKVPYSCHVMCFSCEYCLLTHTNWQQAYRVWWVSRGGGGAGNRTEGISGCRRKRFYFFIALLSFRTHCLHSALYIPSLLSFIAQFCIDSLFLLTCLSVIGQGTDRKTVFLTLALPGGVGAMLKQWPLLGN